MYKTIIGRDYLERILFKIGYIAIYKAILKSNSQVMDFQLKLAKFLQYQCMPEFVDLGWRSQPIILFVGSVYPVWSQCGSNRVRGP